MRPPAYVSIVTAVPGSLDTLRTYLGGVGVSSHCTSAVEDFEMVAPESAAAAVIFPDDFNDGEIVALTRQLHRARSRFLSVVVTSEPQRFRDAVLAHGGLPTMLLMPKPSFAWDILDAIRAHIDSDPVR